MTKNFKHQGRLPRRGTFGLGIEGFVEVDKGGVGVGKSTAGRKHMYKGIEAGHEHTPMHTHRQGAGSAISVQNMCMGKL